MLLWLSQVRGLRWQVIGYLIGSCAAALLTANVTVQLRTPADRMFVGSVLDSGVLIGLVLPIAVLANLLQDRSPWLSVTSPRRQESLRAAWLGALLLGTFSVSLTIAALLPVQISARLVVADFMVLFALALGGAVVLGGQLAWLPPAVVALACSVPGLVPIRANWLALADHATEVGVIGAAGIISFGTLFVVMDEYGLSRYRRVFHRISGVTED